LSKTYIKLDEAPEILQDKVKQVIDRHTDGKVLSVSVITLTPYIDKTIISTVYTAHIQISNYFTALRYSICSNSEWTDREVRENFMLAAEIIEFVKQCDWLQYGVREALNSGGS
jgi:hypothetical protein